MCPSSVHKVTKMRNSYNMVLLTFFGSTLPDRVHIGPINHRVGVLFPALFSVSHATVESSERCDGNPPDLTKVTHAVDVHFPPVSSEPLKGLTKRHRSSAESIDLAQPKQYKVSPGTHGRKSSSDRCAMVAPMVSVQPSVTLSVSDRASCDENGLSMESSDDIITAVSRGPIVSKSAVQPDPRPPVTGRNSDHLHHSPLGREAVVHQTSTSQLQVSSHRLIISSQVSHRQTIPKARPSTAPK
ncbi:hypothetical protein E2C01_048393 [Portunus trituberculatus]|uniref:Uncharacterized protein n=1 Tax=Portunus trituberculatus TaxID=210409 RepID=A0A5B7GD91_PORTR|nr:hypothetical protein [Portunus trituberculatus]